MSRTSLQGRVFALQRFCIHDGPGIRTTVFLAGCPLRCAWCHNPECFDAAQAPPWDVDRLSEALLADRAFYDVSGGGITLSGGEPLLQPEFCAQVLQRMGRAGLHRCVQTAGAVPWSAFEAVLPQLELVQFDVKLLDSLAHLRWTGSDNARILDNATRLAAAKVCVEWRTPWVPGVSDTAPHLEALARWSLLHGGRLTLVPYQRLYLDKYGRLGLEARCATTPAPTREELAAAAAQLAALGLVVRVEGH